MLHREPGIDKIRGRSAGRPSATWTRIIADVIAERRAGARKRPNRRFRTSPRTGRPDTVLGGSGDGAPTNDQTEPRVFAPTHLAALAYPAAHCLRQFARSSSRPRGLRAGHDRADEFSGSTLNTSVWTFANPRRRLERDRRQRAGEHRASPPGSHARCLGQQQLEHRPAPDGAEPRLRGRGQVRLGRRRPASRCRASSSSRTPTTSCARRSTTTAAAARLFVATIAGRQLRGPRVPDRAGRRPAVPARRAHGQHLARALLARRVDAGPRPTPSRSP